MRTTATTLLFVATLAACGGLLNLLPGVADATPGPLTLPEALVWVAAQLETLADWLVRLGIG